MKSWEAGMPRKAKDEETIGLGCVGQKPPKDSPNSMIFWGLMNVIGFVDNSQCIPNDDSLVSPRTNQQG